MIFDQPGFQLFKGGYDIKRGVIKMTYDNIREQARAAVTELLKKSHMKSGDIFIIGCSSSEIKGAGIGTDSDIDVAKAVYEGVKPLLDDRGISLAAQCCEHLNRAVIIERKALLPGQDIVNVVPQMHAGGSFAMTVYENAQDPVAVESVKADGGMDIGDTLIGMHLRPVAVPVRIAQKTIGEAHVVCARTRPKFVGGSRAVYDEYLSGGDIPR